MNGCIRHSRRWPRICGGFSAPACSRWWPTALADDPDGVHTLALVDRLDFHDLTACAPRTGDWRRAGAAVPLLLSRDEFLRTLDVFPVEYGGIIANHRLDRRRGHPFAGLQVSEADLRRGCELQAKSHLIHLREGFLETGGSPAGSSPG